MAEVYRAQAAGPADFRKLVAIKRLLPQHALDPQLLRMFLDESRLMARFAHANLPHVIDVSDGGGVDVPFFVMEHVAGVDLREVMRAAGGPLPLEHVLGISSAVAAGLHHAHELRADDGRSLEIVHRDVSPSNVLVSFDGGVKVADFGVAKWSQQKSFTYQGQLKGKFAHMSPEQCRGEPLDRRSDVFALGTMMFEMATGQPPFRADSDVAPELRAIILRALKRERDERFSTTREIQLALEAFGRERRLIVSAVELAAYVETLFAAKVAEWRASPSGAEGQPADDFARIGVERTATDVFALEQTLVSRGDGSAGIVATAAVGEQPTAGGARPPTATERRPAPAAGTTVASRRRGPLIGGGLAVAGLLGLVVWRLAQPTASPPPPRAVVSSPAAPPSLEAPRPDPVAIPAPAPVAVAPETPRTAPPPPSSDLGPRPTRSGRTRRSDKDGARLTLAPSPSTAEASGDEGTKATAVKTPPSPSAEAPATTPPARPAVPFSTPRPAATKIWDPDSPVPP